MTYISYFSADAPVLRWTEEGIPVADIVGIPGPNDTQLKVSLGFGSRLRKLTL